MADSKGTFVTASVAGLLAALLVGCGGAEKAPGSGVDMAGTGGTGGSDGSAGSLALGEKGGTGGQALGGVGGMATSLPPTVSLHACGMPEQPCGEKVHTGDVMVGSNEEAAVFKDVSSIVGKLTIHVADGVADGSHIADAFECLESISGDLVLDFSTSSGDSSLWGLRNLKSVDGAIETTAASDRTYADCGLARLQRVGGSGQGKIEIEGFAGGLDLSQLTSLGTLQITKTELTSLKLPVSGTFQVAKLHIENNPFLKDIAGFKDVTVQPSPGALDGVVRITNNPQLSDCRAKEIGQLFISGGAQPAAVVTSGNLACQTP